VRRNILPLIFITGVGLVGVKALFHPGLFSAFDIWHQVARLYHYQQAFAVSALLDRDFGTRVRLSTFLLLLSSTLDFGAAVFIVRLRYFHNN